MPLTFPSAAGLSLLRRVVTTAPVSSVNFDNLSINAANAYRLEFEIILTNFTNDQELVALTQNNAVQSRFAFQRKMTACLSGGPTCTTSAFLTLETGVTTEVFGTFSWRKPAVALADPVGFAQLMTVSGASLVASGYGGFIFSSPIADVTDVGVVTAIGNTPGEAAIDIGSVFRLYEGAG
ncbi:MAG: hypothetical protein GY807_23525 [Gammaproteobacteria bacterium]|nr:hypothetical protein [Gammaproteobacteria bacterium]